MAHVWVLKFQKDTVSDFQKLIQSLLEDKMDIKKDIKKDICKVLSKKEIELMNKDMAYVFSHEISQGIHLWLSKDYQKLIGQDSHQ